MRKLIEYKGSEIVCDNPVCDYSVQTRKEHYADFLNQPCPKCGENLLTEKDYKSVLSLFKFVDFVNRWFSWVTIFMKKPIETKIVRIHTHDGIKIDEVDNIE